MFDKRLMDRFATTVTMQCPYCGSGRIDLRPIHWQIPFKVFHLHCCKRSLKVSNGGGVCLRVEEVEWLSARG
jgi:hypothetical protein